MKKTIILLGFIFLIYIGISNAIASSNLIPNEAIRMRVLANSNSNYDQNIKKKVSDSLKGTMGTILKDVKGVSDARLVIKKNITFIENNINKILSSENYPLGFKVNLGLNYFPEKTHKGITYKEGEYESLLVTIGSGEGNNWWCVLFPPLCLIEADESDEVEYKVFIKELIEKYL